MVGHGPVGRTLSRILRSNGIEVVVIEMNIDTVRQLREQGQLVVHGDASHPEILKHAALDKAEGLIITGRGIDSSELVRRARELNPRIRILARVTYLAEAEALRALGVNEVFSSEGEIALSMTDSLLEQLGASAQQIDQERDRVRRELFLPQATPGGGAPGDRMWADRTDREADDDGATG